MHKIKLGWHYIKEHSRLRRFSIIGIYLISSLGLLIGYGLLNRQSTGNDDTPLNAYQTFSGSSSSQGVKLIDRAYSAKQKRMIATFEMQSSTDPATEITSEYLKFKVATVVSQKIKMVVIPTTENKYVVMVDNLNDNFQAIQFTLINNTPQVQTDTTDSNEAKPTVKFVINDKNSINKQNVSSLNPEEFAIKSIDGEIKDRRRKVKVQKDKIHDYQTGIAADTDKIRTKKVNRKYEVPSQQEKTDSDISTLENERDQLKSSIASANRRIGSLNAAQELLKKKQKAIKDGTYKLPKTTKSTQITRK